MISFEVVGEIRRKKKGIAGDSETRKETAQ